jgi:hypothetical protein
MNIMVLALALGLVSGPKPAVRYHIFFPPLNLAAQDGERIVSLEIDVACGHFRGIATIPDDWSLQVMSPVSERTALRASAGHGSTALWNLDELDGAIVVSVDDPGCFDISATVVSANQQEEHRHEFQRQQLLLKP